MRSPVTILILCAIAAPALADEPVGCDQFKWPIDKERATLTGTDLPKVVSGSRIKWPLPFATMMSLNPFAEAKLPIPPERAPKSEGSFAGFVQIPTPAKVGTYKVTLSSEGWIDVLQDGRRLKSVAATGATGCAGVRKSVKFELSATPFVVQISSVGSDTIGIAIAGE
jgi:hypothetical protein